MKRTLTINLGGIVFNIDEDAYTLLSNYFTDLRTAFGQESDGAEIISDIESRISEILCCELSDPARQVVSIDMIVAIIDRIGSAQTLGADSPHEEAASHGRDCAANGGADPCNGGEFATTPPPYHKCPPAPKVKKRLFRNPADKMLGGVCSGIASYLGVDPTWVRLITVALVFLSFSTVVIAYLVLWIVLPEANTATQQLAMQGEAPTVENISRTVADGASQESNAPVKKKTFADQFVAICGAIGGVIMIILSVIALPVVFCLAIAFVVVLCLLLLDMAGKVSLIGVFPSLPGTVEIIGALSGMIMIGIPLLLLIYATFRNALKLGPLSTATRWTAAILWILSIAAITILAAIF